MKIITQDGICPSKVYELESIDKLKITKLDFEKPIYGVELKKGLMKYRHMLGTYDSEAAAQKVINKIGSLLLLDEEEYKLPDKSRWSGLKSDNIPSALRGEKK